MFNWSKRQLGKYFLVRKIGSGGMSSVYKAIDQDTKKTVAVKVLPPGLDDAENFRRRFEREAKILMRLRHPHIVPLLDFGDEDGIYFMVMPLMEVGTLRERLHKGPIRPEEGAIIIRQIAEALQFAHNAGMVHRDVKPSNVLMDSEGNAWLSDFGTAYVRNATASRTGSSVHRGTFSKRPGTPRKGSRKRRLHSKRSFGASSTSRQAKAPSRSGPNWRLRSSTRLKGLNRGPVCHRTKRRTQRKR